MSTILIKSDDETGRMLSELAKKLGSEVVDLADEKYEDLALAIAMDAVETGKEVSEEEILKQLRTNK
jgi:predicted transcriptional regulator